MRCLLLVCALCLLPWGATQACANDLNDWMSTLSVDGQPYGGDDDFAEVVAGSSLQLRMHGIADRGLGSDAQRALDPCSMGRSERGRFFCWSSYGRNLHMYLPQFAWQVVGVFLPRTLYSYKSVDVRFPPSVRVRLPFNATADVGYEDQHEPMAFHLRLKF